MCASSTSRFPGARRGAIKRRADDPREGFFRSPFHAGSRPHEGTRLFFFAGTCSFEYGARDLMLNGAPPGREQMISMAQRAATTTSGSGGPGRGAASFSVCPRGLDRATRGPGPSSRLHSTSTNRFFFFAGAGKLDAMGYYWPVLDYDRPSPQMNWRGDRPFYSGAAQLLQATFSVQRVERCCRSRSPRSRCQYAMAAGPPRFAQKGDGRRAVASPSSGGGDAETGRPAPDFGPIRASAEIQRDRGTSWPMLIISSDQQPVGDSPRRPREQHGRRRGNERKAERY